MYIVQMLRFTILQFDNYVQFIDEILVALQSLWFWGWKLENIFKLLLRSSSSAISCHTQSNMSTQGRAYQILWLFLCNGLKKDNYPLNIVLFSNDIKALFITNIKINQINLRNQIFFNYFTIGYNIILYPHRKVLLSTASVPQNTTERY